MPKPKKSPRFIPTAKEKAASRERVSKALIKTIKKRGSSLSRESFEEILGNISRPVETAESSEKEKSETSE